eukprot:m.1291053 g.1291053  ORF g.1291053 m.1291053 type:complete len:57 (-) comp24784_c0_seq39:834-1004(-)
MRRYKHHTKTPTRMYTSHGETQQQEIGKQRHTWPATATAFPTKIRCSSKLRLVLEY